MQTPSQAYLGHSAIDDKVGSVDEAALITGEEQHGLCLFNCLTETARREVHLTTVALGLVITEPVLKERGAGQTLSAEICSNAEEEAHLRGAGHRALKR